MVEINLKLNGVDSNITIHGEHTSVEEIAFALDDMIDVIFKGLIERGITDSLILAVLQSMHEEANERVFKMLINRKCGVKNDEQNKNT